jgi:addiction module RelB/DinJ family antitoxin
MKNVTVRVPSETYETANQVLGQLGLDMPGAIRIFLRTVAATRSIPFPLDSEQVSWEDVPVDAATQASMDKLVVLGSGRNSSLR